MKDTYNILSEKLEVMYIKLILPSQDFGFLANHFQNFFASGLIPISPCHWPSYFAGITSSNNMPDFSDKFKNPLNNLVKMTKYLKTAQSGM